MDLSIIIPAWNEARKIACDIEAADDFLVKAQLQGEIIVADDGSSDGTADSTERAAMLTDNPVLIESGQAHRGKGYALRQGFARSTGDYVMFADSGVCVPYAEALAGIQWIREGQCQIAHGSRKMDRHKIVRANSLYRRICSEAFRFYVHWMMRIPSDLTDTQCGFKIYRGDVGRELYGQSITDGFMIDIEVIMRARQAGYVIKEFPVPWVCDPDSRVKPMHESVEILRELTRLKKIIHSR